MDWQERIVVDPKVLGGKPAIKGTRLSVSLILELLASGSSEASILAGYSRLSVEDIRACLRYASDRVGRPKIPAISAMVDSAVVPDEVRTMLSKANARFNYLDPGEGSLWLWQAVEWSIREVAAQRGWPAGDIDELEQAIERLENETGADDASLNLVGGFINALAVRNNADGKWLCESEIEFYANLMPPFIESIFAAAGRPNPYDAGTAPRLGGRIAD